MNRNEIKNIIELQEYLEKGKFIFDILQPFTFKNIHFNFEFGLNFSELLKLKQSNPKTSEALTFKAINHYIFDNCRFEEKILIRETFEKKLTFRNNCIINGLNFDDVTFTRNIRFYECAFKNGCSFNNTKFEDLIDFWNSTFEIPILFFKTDFLSTAVFASCTFNENLLFTYSLFKDQIIFRGTTFLKGLDISLALNAGEFNFFNIKLNNFKSEKHLGEESYNNMISNFIIPTINKKETFRLLKQHFHNNGDDLEYVKYLKLEKVPTLEIIFDDLKHSWSKTTWVMQFSNFFHHLFDIISLGLNKISNNHRNSYLLGLIFTITIGLTFFTFSVISLPDYHFEIDPRYWYMENFWIKYLTFMNPTHNVDLFDSFNPTGWTYLWQTLGRIFVGYGIYQTIQAFRKLK